MEMLVFQLISFWYPFSQCLGKSEPHNDSNLKLFPSLACCLETGYYCTLSVDEADNDNPGSNTNAFSNKSLLSIVFLRHWLTIEVSHSNSFNGLRGSTFIKTIDISLM